MANEFVSLGVQVARPHKLRDGGIVDTNGPRGIADDLETISQVLSCNKCSPVALRRLRRRLTDIRSLGSLCVPGASTLKDQYLGQVPGGRKKKKKRKKRQKPVLEQRVAREVQECQENR